MKRPVYIEEQTPFGRKLAAGQFWPCFGRPMSVEGDSIQSISKNMKCSKKLYLPKFSNWAYKLKSLLPIDYLKKWFKWASSISKIVEHLIFLLTDCIWSHSPDFGRPKYGQNCPAATFPPKGVCSLMCTGLLTFYGPSEYLSSFPRNGPKSKNFQFVTDFLVRPQKKYQARVRSILMPLSFHIASLNRYTQKFSGLP